MEDSRTYVAALADFTCSVPEIDSFVFDGSPPAFRHWGIAGALRFLRGGREARVTWINDTKAAQEMAAGPVAVLRWDEDAHKVTIQISRP
jgi:hypothetical protein